MSDDIALHSFSFHKNNESNIEEYHEIQETSTLADVPDMQYLPESISEHDFFTKYDIKSHDKNIKKKKTKKKERVSNLMDIISAELALSRVPITENMISTLDYSKERQNIYVKKSLRSLHAQRRRTFDSELGWGGKADSIALDPTFLKVVENAESNKHYATLPYVSPEIFNDLMEDVSNSGIEQSTKFLHISISNLKFNHHHTFSLEKLLCAKLVECFNEYSNNKGILTFAKREVQVSRETKDKLKKELININPTKKDHIRFDQTVRKYTKEIIDMNFRYHQSLKKEKELIHRILSLWYDIEIVREKQKRIDTPYTLQVVKESLDTEDFEREWNETFTLEYIDSLDKLEYDYVDRYIEYKEGKRASKIKSSEKEKQLGKPKMFVDEILLKESVERLVNDIVTKEKVALYLRSNEAITPNGEVDNDTVCFKIYVDDIFVCESESYSIDTFFGVDFIEEFSVQILPMNKILSLVLYENDIDVSSLKINLADMLQNSNQAQFSKGDLFYRTVVEPNTECVGAGHNIKVIAAASKVRLKSSNIFKGNLYTNGKVSLKIGWNDTISENQNEVIKNSMDIGRKLKRLIHGTDKANIESLTSIINNIYGQDFSNHSGIIDTLKDICEEVIKPDCENFPENNTDLARLKLLHLRNIGELEHVENKLIPLHATQISTELLNCLQKYKENDFNIQYLNQREMDMDPIELQRFIGSRYIQKLNKNTLRNLNEYLLKKTHKDVVRDFKNLSLRGLFSNQSNIVSLATMSSSTKQQLLLNSLSKEQEILVTVVRAYNFPDRHNSILTEDGEDDDKIAGFKVRPLRPFVRVSYRGTTIRTGTAIGCHPTWNQTVKLITRLEPVTSIHINLYDECKENISEADSEDGQSLHSKTVHYRYYNKWLGTLQVPLQTVLTLGTLRGVFKINTPPLLFGYESAPQVKGTAPSLIPEINQLMKNETSFISLQITSSLSHLGGSNGYLQPIPSDPDDYIIKHLNAFVTEYLIDFPARCISLTFINSSGSNQCVCQFLQPLPMPSNECFPKNPKLRSESAMSKSSGVSKSSSSKSSGGKKRDGDMERTSLVEERESIYSAYEWREESQLVKMMNAALRYVSLIPTYEVVDTHAVTLLGTELLKVLHGSPLDHTLLLASYYIYLGIKCWVAIGLGLPRGTSSYVLTKYDLTHRRFVLSNDQLIRNKGFWNKSDGFVWYVYDACSGQRTELRDVGCPLKMIDFVFDNENIWVNVQSAQDCESVSFDFNRSSDWQPVFNKAIYVMKQPIITDTGLYSAPTDVERLRNAIENKIRGKIQKWRPHMKTIWNRYCSGLLREILPSLEYWAFNSSDNKPGLNQRLKQLMVTYKMFGFPLNIPYINMKSVVSAVKATTMHVNDDPQVEFGLAVEVFSYPNNVLSVWVFLISVTRLS